MSCTNPNNTGTFVLFELVAEDANHYARRVLGHNLSRRELCNVKHLIELSNPCSDAVREAVDETIRKYNLEPSFPNREQMIADLHEWAKTTHPSSLEHAWALDAANLRDEELRDTWADWIADSTGNPRP